MNANEKIIYYNISGDIECLMIILSVHTCINSFAYLIILTVWVFENF